MTDIASGPLNAEAMDWMSVVSEGFCPVCRVRLETHDDHACCPCGGCAYALADRRLTLSTCEERRRTCDHWAELPKLVAARNLGAPAQTVARGFVAWLWRRGGPSR
jgi:hypothetical protein